MPLFLFGLAAAAWFFLHSLLAAERVKNVLSPAFIPLRFYRLAFNVVAVATLLVLIIWFFRLEKQALWQGENWLAFPGWVFLAAGLVWLVRGLAGYDLSEFFGIYQIKNGQPPTHTTLKINGLNRIVRHPVYFGILQMTWGWFLISPTDAVLTLAVLTTIYLIVGSSLEERKLAQQFGEAWRLYRARVPGLFPFSWGRRAQ